MNAQEVYRCRVCKELWETETAAESCCDHTDELFQCAKCNRAYVVEEEAERCCQ